MAELPEVLGVVYPVSEEVVRNIFNKNRNIFLKFTTHEPTKRTKIRIKEGIKLYFYKSGGEKTIVGEAIISMFEYLPVFEILKKFRSKMIISEQELINYSAGREDKKILVIKISNPIKYKTSIKQSKPVTMAGLYITGENAKKILKK